MSVSVPTPSRHGPGPTRGHLRRRRLWWLALPAAALVLGAGWVWHSHHVSRDWREAQDALRRYDLAGAADSLERHLRRRPEDTAAWFLAARTARRRERPADAERYLERCQQLGGVTDATRFEWDLLRVQRGDFRGIDVRLRATIGPDHPDALLVLEALARGYLKDERLSDARQACDLWIQRQPDHPWPWLWRGQIYERIGKRTLALEDYRRAVENAPDNRDARLALGGILLQRRQPDAAAEHFEHVLGRSPDDHEALLGLAGCRIEQGLAGEAIPPLERVLAANPDSPAAHFLRGKAALQQSDPAGAERWLRGAVRLAPEDAEALHLLVQCLRDQNNDDEAGRLARRLEQLRDDVTRLNELIAAVAREPDDSRPRHEAGVIALRIGKPEDALHWFRGALRVKGDYAPTHAALAEYYRSKGEHALAESHRRQAEQP